MTSASSTGRSKPTLWSELKLTADALERQGRNHRASGAAKKLFRTTDILKLKKCFITLHPVLVKIQDASFYQ